MKNTRNRRFYIHLFAGTLAALTVLSFAVVLTTYRAHAAPSPSVVSPSDLYLTRQETQASPEQICSTAPENNRILFQPLGTE